MLENLNNWQSDKVQEEGLTVLRGLNQDQLEAFAFEFNVPLDKIPELIDLIDSGELGMNRSVLEYLRDLDAAYTPHPETPDRPDDLFAIPIHPEVKDIKASMNKSAIAQPRFFFSAGKDGDNMIVRIVPNFVKVWDKYEAAGEIPKYEDKPQGMIGRWAGNKDKLVPLSDLHNLAAAWKKIAGSEEVKADLETQPDQDIIIAYHDSLEQALRNSVDNLIQRASKKKKGIKKMSTRRLRKIALIEIEKKADLSKKIREISPDLDLDDFEEIESMSTIPSGELDEREIHKRKLLEMRKKMFEGK